MKNIFKKSKKYLLIIFFFLLLSAAISSYAAQWYRSDPGGVIVVNEHGVCQRVNNQGGRSYFVSTNTAAEWIAFRSAVPSLDNVTLNGCECSLPWGGTISHGQSVTAYQSSSVPCGSTCVSQTRTCNDGTLSGTYQHQSCSVQACLSCALPWGGAISHGQSVTAYQSSSVPCGSTCASQTRTCNNGTLSGTYQHQSCTVQACGGTWVLVAQGCYSCLTCSPFPTPGTSCPTIGQTLICRTGAVCGVGTCFGGIYECK